MEHSKNTFGNLGFTLIELLIVAVMISILLIGLITTFNPVAQYTKAQDSRRESDLSQIQRALDSYFNDKGCYPTSLTFGQGWSINGQVYMEKVPQDSNCKSNPRECYVYEVPAGACPQWNVLYASLQSKAVPVNACPLVTRNQSNSCLPQGFTNNNYNYCLASGNVDCSIVAAFVIGPAIATPTPTGPFVCPGGQYAGCTANNTCNSIQFQSQCSQNGGNVFCYCDRHCNQQCQFN